MENIIQLTTKNLDQVLSDTPLLLIDFWAEWCQPCQQFKRVIHSIAPEYPDFVFASVDIDGEEELAKEFNVTSVPMIMILREHVVVYHDSGSLTPTSLRELLDKTKELDMSSIKE